MMNEKSFTHTNCFLYLKIANESFEAMNENIAKNVIPKPNGEEGNVVKADPEQKSFKSSMVSVVFFAMYLDSILHILISKKVGIDEYKKYDFKKYEDKLRILGVSDPLILKRVENFRNSRKELVHEKALYPSEFRKGQDEANKANQLIKDINTLLGISV